MKFCSLFSGSSGNSLFIEHNGTRILCDAGYTGKRVENALREIGEEAKDLNAIIITHEHTDHVNSAGVLSRRYNIPLYANLPTWSALHSQKIGKIKPENELTFENNKSFTIGDLKITPFRTSHDAASSVGYTIESGNKKIGIATDTGIITPDMPEYLFGSDLVVLEANHELDMLQRGPYPLRLKERIAGSFGHLSNDTAGHFAADLIRNGTENIVLAHLSHENNLPHVARRTVTEVLGQYEIDADRDLNLDIAIRDSLGNMFKL